MNVSKEDIMQFLYALDRNNEEERMAALVGYELAEKADDILRIIIDVIDENIQDKPPV